LGERRKKKKNGNEVKKKKVERERKCALPQLQCRERAPNQVKLVNTITRSELGVKNGQGEKKDVGKQVRALAGLSVSAIGEGKKCWGTGGGGPGRGRGIRRGRRRGRGQSLQTEKSGVKG